MRFPPALLILAPVIAALSSCMKEPERKPAPPPGTQTSKIPWNTPVAGQGQGQFGMMDQNRYRR